MFVVQDTYELDNWKIDLNQWFKSDNFLDHFKSVT